jgi:hypothetical protein
MHTPPLLRMLDDLDTHTGNHRMSLGFLKADISRTRQQDMPDMRAAQDEEGYLEWERIICQSS